jgi:hypothetical protein
MAALLVTAVGGVAIRGTQGVTAADAPAARGAVDVESLGNLLASLGLKTEKTESRYDFAYTAKHGEDWELSMSVVLSNDKKSIWMMAWLDELPTSAQEVPRLALLRLLSDNDKMGAGQFFAYVASNRRFVLQRVVPNENLTTASFRQSLTDLGKTVVNTYPHWCVANWKDLLGPQGAEGAESQAAEAGGKPTNSAAAAGSRSTSR